MRLSAAFTGGLGAERRLAAVAAAESQDAAPGVAVAEASVEGGATLDKQHVRRLYDELRAKFGYIGAVNHKEVGARDIFRILRDARSESDFLAGMQMMNVYYNFGVKLRHREIASRLLAAAMRCKVEAEAVELVKLYGTWLRDPPDKALVYAVMGHFLDAGEPMVVRELAQAMREDWRMPVEAPLYTLAIEAMLQLPERPLQEALLLYVDAQQVGVRLPAPLHARLLDEALRTFEATTADSVEEGDSAAEGEEAFEALRGALRAADGLARDGHLRGGGSAASFCSLAWFFWHLARLPDAARLSLLADAEPYGATAVLEGKWVRALEAALDNFGCHWGFSAQLPAGLFRALEASKDSEAKRHEASARQRLGRFYPEPGKGGFSQQKKGAET